MENFPIMCWSLSERFPNVWPMRLGQRFCTPVHSGISKLGTLLMRRIFRVASVELPGTLDTSTPDGIQNPKLHLKHLLGNRVYTARISEEIAIRLDAPTIAERSPSFRGFVDAVMNGPGHYDG